ncbi:MAG: phosphatase PAP2 family protein [Bacteroidota bacterium]|nr:phosphatase PAP2 family protein [Bacteroidota bacterium]
MRKFTTIILLWSTFSIFSTQISAQNTDIELLRSINKSSSTGLRNYSKFISNTTTAFAVSTPIVMGAVALLEKNDDLLKNAVYVGVSLGVDGVLTYSMKEVVKRPRPYPTYQDIKAFETETSLSFPSGHTSLAFATATALSLKYPKWYVIAPTYFWAASVGYSRMNLGMHYPSDVLAGALVGAGSAYVTNLVNNWFWKKNENKKLIGLQAYL